MSGLYFLLYVKTPKERLFLLGLTSIFTLMLLLTFARVAWVALFIFVFLLALLRFRLLLFPLILFPFVLSVFSPVFQERVLESFHPTPDSSIVWRQTLWSDVTRYSLQQGRTVFGSGMDTFPLVSEAVRGITNGPNDPHNDFVKFFVEGGVVGVGVLLLYLFTLLTLLVRGYRQERPDSRLRLAYGILILFFFTLELSALTDNVFKNTPVQWIFFATFGALLAISETKKKLA